MPDFQRLFPFIGRLFPPSLGGIVKPSEVTESVQLVHEILRADAKHVFYLTTQNLSGAGAGINVDLALIPQPGPGFVTIPQVCAIFSTGNAAPIRVQILMVGVGTPGIEDIRTGVWAGDLAFLTIDLTADHWVTLPLTVPVPRGNQITATFELALAGTTVRVRSFGIQFPLEVVDFQRMQSGGTFSRTQAA